MKNCCVYVENRTDLTIFVEDHTFDNVFLGQVFDTKYPKIINANVSLISGGVRIIGKELIMFNVFDRNVKIKNFPYPDKIPQCHIRKTLFTKTPVLKLFTDIYQLVETRMYDRIFLNTKINIIY